MRKFQFCFFLLISGFWASAQIGVSAQFLSYPLDTEEELYGIDFYDASYGFAVDYWLRLKNYRWEMVPTVSANFGTSVNAPNPFSSNLEVSMWASKFHVKNNFYILDFKNDCDCPTFSKQSGWFSKSFFLQISPGVAFHRVQATSISESSNFSDNRWQAELGLGAGFDFGISDLRTISPYFNYVLSSKTDAHYIPNFAGSEDFRTNHFLAGIRLGLRPDYARPSSRRRRAIGF